MSLDPILWAMKDAPTADVNEFSVLLCLAESADEDGCDAFPSVKTIAAYTKLSTRTVQRVLGALQERRLIAEGDPGAARYIPEWKRPTVYDLLIPYGWFSNIERTNAFRAQRGRPPITPEDRPAIAPAPPKKARADKGQPKKRGRQEVTPVDNPEEGATTSHPVTISSEGGDYKSQGGRLQVTQTSPINHPDDPPRPSVGSSGEDGGTDGEQLDTKTKAQALERTPGVALLLGLAHERPELLLTGKVLANQAVTVDGLLEGGWSQHHIASELLRPLPPKTRSVGAVISRRLRDMAASPVPQAMPAPRESRDAEGERWDAPTPTPAPYGSKRYDTGIPPECEGKGGGCGVPVPAHGDLCPGCAPQPAAAAF